MSDSSVTVITSYVGMVQPITVNIARTGYSDSTTEEGNLLRT